MFDANGPGSDDPAVLDFTCDSDGSGRIRCPLCGWRPAPSDRWVCGCGESWNTFETRGRCPACAYQWPWTQCLRCHRRSEHERWYE